MRDQPTGTCSLLTKQRDLDIGTAAQGVGALMTLAEQLETAKKRAEIETLNIGDEKAATEFARQNLPPAAGIIGRYSNPTWTRSTSGPANEHARTLPR